ncbi:MAG TPA: integrase core domain-containing protein [Thermoleophilaceae bacterium]|jgi:transposase InsO family protein
MRLDGAPFAQWVVKTLTVPGEREAIAGAVRPTACRAPPAWPNVRRAGAVHVISVLDDRTRLAYAEIHAAENKHSVSATLRRAVDRMRAQSCGPQAVMSDNALCYVRSEPFRRTLAELGARHVTIPPRTPRWNGKVERFNQTLDSEWAHARVWPDSSRRDRALSSFLRYYNRRRPHTSLGDRPPISRVQQVRGQDS